MYSVSNNYLNALAAPVKTFRLIGTVGTVSFDESNIIDISIDNQVSEGSEIKIGSVYAGVLTATFNGLTIARGSWVGKTITLSEGLLIDPTTDTYEDVPLGIFTVAEANHTAEGVEVTAYDAMTNFDKTRNDLTDTGTAYAFLTLMCQKCGVTLGSTLADIQALPNGTETFSIYAENDIETWRDLLSWIAQTLGAVATIGRDGKLYLRQYSMTAAATIDETHRFTGCSFSDFVTYYTGMSVVNIALRQTEYKSEVVDDGLTYNLGSNPLVQGHYEYVQEIIDDFSNVALTPFNAQMLGGAIYDLCDCLTFSGGIAAGATCGVMGYTWKYNGAYSVKGFGANPALATAKSKTQKELEALYNTVGQDINEMSVVQNSTAVTIAENTETSILTYNFEVTEEENTTMIDVSVVMTATATETLVGEVYTLADLVAQLRFYVDNSQVTVYDPTFIVDEGKDTMTFNYSLSGLSVGAHEFDIRLEMSGGSGSVAVGDVHEMLWGYGITFEVYVKNIAVTQMPTKTVYYVGQHLNYAGLEVSKVYNNGLLEDVTADCTLDPAEGEEMTEVGTVTVDVDFEDFSTDFTLDVQLLNYQLKRSAYYLPETGKSSYPGELMQIGNDLYYVSIILGTTLTVDYVKLIVASDGTITAGTSGQVSHSINAFRTPYLTRKGNVLYHVGTSLSQEDGKFFEIGYIDLETMTAGDMTVTCTYDGTPGTPLFAYYIPTTSDITPASVVGDYMVFPKMKCSVNTGATPYPQYTGTAWGEINGTSISIHIQDANSYDSDFAFLLGNGCVGEGVRYCTPNNTAARLYGEQTHLFKYWVADEITAYEVECDSAGVRTTPIDTYEIAGTGSSGIWHINGSDFVYFHLGAKRGMFDPDAEEFTEWDYTALSPSIETDFAYDSDKALFFCMGLFDYWDNKTTLYYSEDLQTFTAVENTTDYFTIASEVFVPFCGHLITIGRNSSASTNNKVAGAIVFEV